MLIVVFNSPFILHYSQLFSFTYLMIGPSCFLAEIILFFCDHCDEPMITIIFHADERKTMSYWLKIGTWISDSMGQWSQWHGYLMMHPWFMWMYELQKSCILHQSVLWFQLFALFSQLRWKMLAKFVPLDPCLYFVRVFTFCWDFSWKTFLKSGLREKLHIFS